jgi:hypothetical protein
LRGRFINVSPEYDDRSVGSLPIRYTERDQLAYLRGPLLALRQFGKLAENSGRIAGQRGLQALVRRLLGMAFDILLGKVLR